MSFVKNIKDGIAFMKQDKGKVWNQKDTSPYHSSSQTFDLTFHVHKSPCNVIGFIDRQDDEYPVKKFHVKKSCFHKKGGFNNPQCNLYNGHYRK